MLKSWDMRFVIETSQTASGNIDLGKMAAARSSNPDVQAFSKLTAEQYTQMDRKLAEFAALRRATLPDEIPARELGFRNKLQNQSSLHFDHAYMKAMVKENKRELKKFRAEMKKGRDPAVQKFASETLPILEDHLDRARNLFHATAGRTSHLSGEKKS